MSIDVRAIAAEEAVRYRRAVRAGFLTARTVDDEEWARDSFSPFECALAAWDGDDIVATYASFPSELTVPGGSTVAVGAVTAVTCQATHRRRGLLSRIITQDLAASKERGAVADVLIAAEYPIYGRFGYGPAVTAVSWELDARPGVEFVTPGEGTVRFVDGSTFRQAAPHLFEQVRRARPGMKARVDLDWDLKAGLRHAPEAKAWSGFHVVCHDDAGTPVGYATYTIEERYDAMRPEYVLNVGELLGVTPAAEARLWRFCTELDLVRTIKAADRPVDDALPLLLHNARQVTQTSNFDFIWVRPLDVPALLGARTSTTSGRVVIEVLDELGLAAGRFVLDASPDGVTCSPTDESADLTMPVRTLGAASLGGVPVTRLLRAGWLDEHRSGAAAAAGAALSSPTAPWCNTWF